MQVLSAPSVQTLRRDIAIWRVSFVEKCDRPEWRVIRAAEAESRP